MSILEKRGGVFVQYYENDVLITIPEAAKEVTDKKAWHFYIDETGQVYETYMVKADCRDATSYDLYITHTSHTKKGEKRNIYNSFGTKLLLHRRQLFCTGL